MNRISHGQHKRDGQQTDDITSIRPPIKSGFVPELIDLTGDDDILEVCAIISKSPQIKSKTPIKKKFSPKKKTKCPISDKRPKGLDDWIPVTKAHVRVPMDLVKQHKGTIASVFDPMFYLPQLNMQMIREKYAPIFGHISISQVLVRIEAPKLAKTRDEANQTTYKRMNNAFILVNRSADSINKQSLEKRIFWCPIEEKVVIDYLENGCFMLHKNVLYS